MSKSKAPFSREPDKFRGDTGTRSDAERVLFVDQSLFLEASAP